MTTYSVREAAAMLGRPVSTVASLVRRHALGTVTPGTGPGGRARIELTLADVETMRVPPTVPAPITPVGPGWSDTVIPPQHAHIIDAAVEDLDSTRSPAAHRAICARLAHEAYTRGRSDALLGLRTLAEAAAELDLHPITVRQVAARLQLGWRPQRGVLLLTREDIERIRTRPREKTGPKPRRTMV